MSTGPTIIIGVGNRRRGDDGAGPAAAQKLGPDRPGIKVCQHSGEAASLIDTWQGATTAFVIDAMASGAAPGTVRRFDAHDQPLPAAAFAACSTHAFGLAEAIEFARALGRLPARLIVYAIEGKSFDYQEGLSAEVGQAVRAVAAHIRRQLPADAAHA